MNVIYYKTVGNDLLETTNGKLLADYGNKTCQSFLNGNGSILAPCGIKEAVNALCIGLGSHLGNLSYEASELLVLRYEVGLGVNLYDSTGLLVFGNIARANALSGNS